MLRPFFLVAFFFLSAFSWGEAHAQKVDATITAEAKAVSERFVDALRDGTVEQAKGYVTSTAQDELQAGFVVDQKRLRAGAKPTFRFISPYGRAADPKESEIKLVYASETEGKWTTIKLRLYRYDTDPYRVEHWSIDNSEPSPFDVSAVPGLQKIPDFMRWMFLGLAALGLIGLVVLILIVRKKPQWVAPDSETETRAVAMSTRDDPSAD